MQVGAGYSPKLFESMDHAKATVEIENRDSPQGRAIKMEADSLTALMCKGISMKSKICNSDEIRTLAEMA
jgi:hypothetical protein